MRNRATWIVGLAILASAAGARSAEGFGVGLILGEPTGISLKKWIGPESAVDAAAAWSLAENERFQFHADYLVHKFDWLQEGVGSGQLPVYFGIGGRIKLAGDHDDHDHDNDEARVGVRVPFGLAYLAGSVPLEFFFEIVPVLDLVPDTDVDINGAVGFRFYFR